MSTDVTAHPAVAWAAAAAAEARLVAFAAGSWHRLDGKDAQART
jgi:hypothetical protein